MKVTRRIKITSIFILIIIVLILFAFVITLAGQGKLNNKDYDWYYLLFFINLAFVNIITFFANLDEILNLLDRIIGPELSSTEQPKAKEILKKVKDGGIKGVSIDILYLYVLNEFGEDAGIRICEELEKCELIKRRQDNVYITENGRKYLQRIF